MKLSKFGEKFTQNSGILELMEDLSEALSGKNDVYMLGGGNPANIPAMNAVYRTRMQEILSQDDLYEKTVSNYTSSQGENEFLKSAAQFFGTNMDWDITEKNIMVFNGSQTAFFVLFNILAGNHKDDTFKKILLPIVPEYIGYEDQSIDGDIFQATEPILDKISKHSFKYRINFDNINITKDIAAICLSRPTNPTGNVITDSELQKLRALAEANKIPLIIDNAYGEPFPSIIFGETKQLPWDDNIIHSFSLSKVGLPGTRTSILVASEEIVNILSKANAIISLASGSIGQAIIKPLLESGDIIKLSNKHIKPFYQEHAEAAISYINESFDDNLPYFVHVSEGSLFLWLWFEDLPITSYELYQSLKKRNVIIVPGNYFFPGHNTQWKHKDECIRVNYSQDPHTVKEGIKIIAEEIKKLYN